MFILANEIAKNLDDDDDDDDDDDNEFFLWMFNQRKSLSIISS